VVLDIVCRRSQQSRVVPELSETAVAVEAQQGSNRARVMVVVDVLRRRLPTDVAETALGGGHGVYFPCRDAITSLQVIGPRPADPVLRRLATDVVARLAVRRSTGRLAGIAHEVVDRLHGGAIRTPLVALRYVHLSLVAALRGTPTGVLRCEEPTTGMDLAVEAEAVRPPTV
jgi:hypothetical protein